MLKYAALATLLACPAYANESNDKGDLNPEEMTINRVLRDVSRGQTSMMHCAMGYGITKKGDHEDARKVFEACAAAGYTGAMNWMSQLDNNGLGGEYDPDRAAKWDRRSAEAGDSVGKFNYGLDLIRGHGVARDEDAGRAWVDQAAADGLPIAKRLQDAGYDPEEVTPDADNWKYAPAF